MINLTRGFKIPEIKENETHWFGRLKLSFTGKRYNYKWTVNKETLKLRGIPMFLEEQSKEILKHFKEVKDAGICKNTNG